MKITVVGAGNVGATVAENMVKARVEDLKEKKNKKGLETMKRNFERVCKDNPGVFDHFLELLK